MAVKTLEIRRVRISTHAWAISSITVSGAGALRVVIMGKMLYIQHYDNPTEDPSTSHCSPHVPRGRGCGWCQPTAGSNGSSGEPERPRRRPSRGVRHRHQWHLL